MVVSGMLFYSLLGVCKLESPNELPCVDIEVMKNYYPRLGSASSALAKNLKNAVIQFPVQGADASKVHINP
jgi:hypothetical protein